MNVYGLLSGDPSVNNNYAKVAASKCYGLGLRMWWARAEQNPGSYDFSPIIDGLKAAKAKGKKAHVTVLCGTHSPDWIKRKIGASQLIKTSDGLWPNPSNQFVHERFRLMLMSFCQHLRAYEGLIDFIHLGGPQVTKSNEIHLKVSMPKDTMVAAWKQSLATFAEATEQFDGSMPLCLNLSKGYTDRDGIREAVAALCYKTFPTRLRMQHNALDGKTNTTTFKTHLQLMEWKAKGVPVGCEALQPSNHASFKGTFGEMISKALALKLGWLTIYQGDAGRL